MHVPRVLGFRYSTDYQDLGDKMKNDITLDEYELENRLVRVKNVLNRSQSYCFIFTYKPTYRLDPCRGWIRARQSTTSPQSSYDTLRSNFLTPYTYLTKLSGMKMQGRITVPNKGVYDEAYFNPILLYCRTLDVNENAFDPDPSIENNNPFILEMVHMLQYDFQCRTVWEFREPVIQKFKKI